MDLPITDIIIELIYDILLIIYACMSKNIPGHTYIATADHFTAVAIY